ncbi:MAG: hypothetical protein KME20_18075 [Kaiparowitsia implicata GSE-PSE-MK54-09C]|jgi:hypothetical protein|nr:hypothetical protein [Kaiparowitsia implicata GSE-PSE-MK54-09C]
MARYTSLFTVSTTLESFRDLLSNLLQSCHCDIIYDADDYMVAREIPGRVSYAKLVTVEVLIDKTYDYDQEVRMNVVVKNEELPLKRDNHCHHMFNLVNRAVEESRQWHPVESLAG